jgi:hypothetical protein
MYGGNLFFFDAKLLFFRFWFPPTKWQISMPIYLSLCMTEIGVAFDSVIFLTQCFKKQREKTRQEAVGIRQIACPNIINGD